MFVCAEAPAVQTITRTLKAITNQTRRCCVCVWFKHCSPHRGGKTQETVKIFCLATCCLPKLNTDIHMTGNLNNWSNFAGMLVILIRGQSFYFVVSYFKAWSFHTHFFNEQKDATKHKMFHLLVKSGSRGDPSRY